MLKDLGLRSQKHMETPGNNSNDNNNNHNDDDAANCVPKRGSNYNLLTAWLSPNFLIFLECLNHSEYNHSANVLRTCKSSSHHPLISNIDAAVTFLLKAFSTKNVLTYLIPKVGSRKWLHSSEVKLLHLELAYLSTSGKCIFIFP